MLTASVLPKLPESNYIICSYINVTNTIEVCRIANIKNWYFERVIFPGQRLIFEAPTKGILEIYTSQLAHAILTKKISCSDIEINDPSSLSSNRISD